MADLNIPNLSKKSSKYIFKKKLTLRRKSKRKLIRESFFMFSFSVLIIYLNYLIPDKNLIFKNFFSNFDELLTPALNLISYIYEICLVVFIISSLIFALVLFLGSFYRLLKVMKRKTSRIDFK